MELHIVSNEASPQLLMRRRVNAEANRVTRGAFV